MGLQLGLWRVGRSYKPSGQINHLLCAWLPLPYRLSSFPIVRVTFIHFSMVHSVAFKIDEFLGSLGASYETICTGFQEKSFNMYKII